MLIDKPVLHLMALDAIKEIEAAGVKLEAGEELWLHTLACRHSLNTDLIDLSDWLEIEQRCGPLLFRSPSIAAEQWIDDCGEEWFPEGDKMNVLAHGFILVHGRDPSTFAKLNTRRYARLTIRLWMMTVPLTYRQLAEGIEAYYTKRESVETTKPSNVDSMRIGKHWGCFIPMLIRYYGGTREDWVFRKSALEFREAVNSLPQVMRSEHVEDVRFSRWSEFREAVNYIKRGRVAA